MGKKTGGDWSTRGAEKFRRAFPFWERLQLLPSKLSPFTFSAVDFPLPPIPLLSLSHPLRTALAWPLLARELLPFSSP